MEYNAKCSGNEKMSEITSQSSDLKPSIEWSRHYFCDYLGMKIIKIIEEVLAEILDGIDKSIHIQFKYEVKIK